MSLSIKGVILTPFFHFFVSFLCKIIAKVQVRLLQFNRSWILKGN
jgi:hypothetical protein